MSSRWERAMTNSEELASLLILFPSLSQGDCTPPLDSPTLRWYDSLSLLSPSLLLPLSLCFPDSHQPHSVGLGTRPGLSFPRKVLVFGEDCQLLS
jgi:hypothetical protein